MENATEIQRKKRGIGQNYKGKQEIYICSAKNGCKSERLRDCTFLADYSKYPDYRCVRTSMSEFRKEPWMVNLPLYAISLLGKVSGSRDTNKALDFVFRGMLF